MNGRIKRTTIYLDADLHKALRLKAVSISRSVSDLVNEAIRESLAEEAEDIRAFEQRGKEPLISHDEMVKRNVRIAAARQGVSAPAYCAEAIRERLVREGQITDRTGPGRKALLARMDDLRHKIGPLSMPTAELVKQGRRR